MTTSVSSYRSGSPRFGTRDPKSLHGEVVTYTLSPEELEAYRKGRSTKIEATNKPSSSEMDKENLDEKRKEPKGMQYLSKDEYLSRKNKGISDKAILDEFNLSHNRLNVQKKEWGLIGQFGPAAKESHAEKVNATVSDTDNINPDHYKVGGIETYDFIKAKLTNEGLKGYLSGNIIKYVSRFDHKNGVEDLKKAQWYLDKLVGLGEK